MTKYLNKVLRRLRKRDVTHLTITMELRKQEPTYIATAYRGTEPMCGVILHDFEDMLAVLDKRTKYFTDNGINLF